jgi:Domain of unknown function (DUF4150)
MFPAATMEGGAAIGEPDVCLTTPLLLPIPYVDTGQLNITVGAAPNVFVRMMPVVLLPSVIPTSTGDEPGRFGGVVSGTTKGQVAFTQASSKVFAAGNPVVYLGCTTVQNNANTAGTLSSVTQTVVLVAP